MIETYDIVSVQDKTLEVSVEAIVLHYHNHADVYVVAIKTSDLKFVEDVDSDEETFAPLIDWWSNTNYKPHADPIVLEKIISTFSDYSVMCFYKHEVTFISKHLIVNFFSIDELTQQLKDQL